MGASLGRAERCDTTRILTSNGGSLTCYDCDVIRSLTLSCDGGRNPDAAPTTGKYILYEGGGKVSSSDLYSDHCQVEEDTGILYCTIKCDSRDYLVLESFRPMNNQFTVENLGYGYGGGPDFTAHVVSSSLCYDEGEFRSDDLSSPTECCRWEYYND